MDVSIIIPAYNEEARVARVLTGVGSASLRLERASREVIVVNDGSTDNTSAAARGCPGVIVLDLAGNQGKGAALWAGALAASGETLVFLDADLEGLHPGHIEELLAPLRLGGADMTVGLFRGGRGPTDFSHWITPWVSGQRAIRRGHFLAVAAAAGARMGIETVLTHAARKRGWRVRYVPLAGVSHLMKEEKLGVLPGLRARWAMYGEMARAWTSARFSQ